MPAYYIAEHIITDPAKFEEYRGQGWPDDCQAWRTLPHQGRKP